MTRKLLKFVNVVADNENVAQLARKYSPKSVVIIDAFLPTLYKGNICKEFTIKYNEVLINKNYTISMVGWFCYYKGGDLYGFDIALKAFYRFKKQIDENVLISVSINDIRSEELHKRIKNYIAKNNLDNNVLFIYEEMPEIWPIYITSKVLIRPTCTDGSALSVKEAMWFETPVVASDCIPRPEGVILSKNCPSDELFGKLMKVYKSNGRSNDAKDKISKIKNKKFKCKLFNEIYRVNSKGDR